ncbi:MAG: MFS transporter [Acidimicrobiia bacterium]|nr:MFS transporter [Acidimicrobiia bacterium]
MTEKLAESLPEVHNSDAARLPIRDKRFWFCLALSLLVGLTINLIPVTFKVFQKLFRAGYEMQGRTEALYFVGALVGSLLAGAVTSRTGPSLSARAGLALGSLGCFLIGSAQNFSMLQAGCLLMGLGSVWLSIIYGTVIAECFQTVRQRVFAAVNLTMAISGTLAPMGLGRYVSTAWLEWGWPWWIPYVSLAAIFLLCQLVVPSIPRKPPAQHSEPIALGSLLRSAALWLIGLGTILHGIGQMGAVVWLARLYEGRLGLSESQVGMMISTNLFGFITGRIILTRYGGRLPDRVLLGCSACTGSIFYLLTIMTGEHHLGLLFIYLAGIGMSGDAISLQSFTALRFSEAAPKAFAFTQALGHMGAAFGPYFIGFVGDRSGTLEQAVWIVPITIGTLSLLGFGWQLTDRLKAGAKPQPA